MGTEAENQVADVLQDMLMGKSSSTDEDTSKVEEQVDKGEEEKSSDVRETEQEGEGEAEVTEEKDEESTGVNEETSDVNEGEEENGEDVTEASEGREGEKGTGGDDVSVEDTSKTSIETDTADDTEVEHLRAQNAQLMSMLNDGATIPIQAAQEVTTAEDVVKEPQKEELQQSVITKDTPLTDDEFTELLASPKKFEEYFLSRDGRIRQQVLLEQEAKIAQILDSRERVNNFFAKEENESIRPVRNLVHNQAVIIARKNPSLSFEEVLKTAADNIRGLAMINATSAEKTKDTPRKTRVKSRGDRRFAKSTNTRAVKEKSKKTTSTKADAIADTLDALMKAGQR